MSEDRPGGARTGARSSKSLKYSQEITSPDEGFETFDSRGLNFLYQEERKDGRQSNFFRLENPTREDA